MTTSRNRFEEPRRNRVFNLPLFLTVGAMILLGITTVTLGFLLWPEPRHQDSVETPFEMKMPGQAPLQTPDQTPAATAAPEAPSQGPGQDAGPDAGAGQPDGR